ncbi:MAG: substrate-binding domain-containing protein [Solirubrobacteraceae bacterium]|nr:substrate-binding domain-containing protein [Solirubrobacteraceae bacterium]
MRRAARALAAGGCSVLLAGALSGCGVDIGASDTAPTADLQRAAVPEQRERQARAARLPRRPAGQLVIAGEWQGSLSSNAVKNFAAAQQQVRPRYSAVGATESFARLCRGEVDVVDSARPISRAELALCNSNGLEIRTPIQIASDAIVLATRNESDVGGDCLTVDEVRDVYRSGATIDNWNALGFDDLPLTATGPDESANAFSFFASRVLQVSSGATLGDLRGDYQAQTSDDDIRRAIIGADRERRVPSTVEQELRVARAELAERRLAYVGNAVAAARERVLAAIRAENRRRARRNQPVNDPAALERRNRLRVDAAKRRAADRARTTFDRRFDTLRETRTRELLDRARRTGVVGFVRFGYYEAYEEQLRPLEIDAGPARDAALAASDRRSRAAGITPPERLPSVDDDGNRIPNCIFPSQLTITTGEYPLSRRVLLYTSTRGLQRAEVRAFLAHALRNAQELATSTRLVPIPNRLRAEQYRFVTGTALEQTAEQRLPGERAPTTTRRRTPATTTTTSTTPQPPASPGTTSAGAPRVPGVSSGGTSTREESP